MQGLVKRCNSRPQMRFFLWNLTSCLDRKLTSLYKFQVQLPIYNVHAIMHGLHELTGNGYKSLKVNR